MLNAEEIAALIEKMHIFYGASEDNLFDVSERVEERFFKAGETIFEAEEKAQSFYIIYSGRVAVTRETGGQRKQVFSHGDYLGEDALLPDEERLTLVKAKEDSYLFELSSSSIAEIPDTVEFLRGGLIESLAARALGKEINLDWLTENEAIYFFVRKHIVLFWQRLFFPLFLFIIGFPVVLWGMWVGSSIPFIFGVVSTVFGAGWLLWDWLDWRNDYYIVTNQRVIWVERVTGIYDSRQIMHYSEMSSIDVRTDAIVQSFFDYGDVNINTIFEGISLKYVPDPQQARRLIDELWQRSKSAAKKAAKKRLHDAIIEQIEAAKAIEKKKKTPPPPPPAPVAPVAPTPKRTLKVAFPKKKRKQKSNKNVFTLRYQQGNDIIYRKHFVILIRNAGSLALASFAAFLFFLYELYLYFLAKSEFALPISFTALIAVGSFIVFGFAYYQYLDWSNDVFKVSQNKIFDIDRKPFGDIQSRSAPLDNIESTEYRRRGLMSIFFNFGTVYIHIGAEEFEFEDVLDPASVQQDINSRYMAHHERQQQAKEKKERDQMIKWLVAYHQSADEINAMLEELDAVTSGDDE